MRRIHAATAMALLASAEVMVPVQDTNTEFKEPGARGGRSGVKKGARIVGAVGPGRVKASRKVGRNDPCPCGSSKKFKKCCGG